VTDPRYPIGEFVFSGSLDAAERAEAIDLISRVPGELRRAVADLSAEQLNTPYRDGGWTVRQVVHHLPDSHLNAYMRWKLALTEDVPTIRTYEEARWAELPDSEGSIEHSLDLLEALHARWVTLLRQLPEDAWGRRLHHPEIGEVGLDHMLAMYAWHGRHHVAHITTLREQRGW
jgi:uncharacterized damage-inducible protein DinB